MNESVASPTHNRLLSALRAIGPYLRETESKEGSYLFDCLSVCVDDKKSPEEREFWGWWMQLEVTEEGYSANFSTGIYNLEGNWDRTDVPEKQQNEVERTRSDFMNKLTKVMEERFSLSITLHEESEVSA